MTLPVEKKQGIF